MIKKGRERAKHRNTKKEDAPENQQPWFDTLIADDIVDILPVMKNVQGERIQLPIHNSTVTIATMIREKYPQKFRINLDVYKSMLYAGRQLFDYVFLKHDMTDKEAKLYKMAKLMEDVDETFYDSVFVEDFLKKNLEGYVTYGTGKFSRDSIICHIEEAKQLMSKDLQERCDNFIDEELDSSENKVRVQARLRKRKEREQEKVRKSLSVC